MDKSLPRQFLPIVATGVVGGLDGISFAIAIASLLFAGNLSSGLGVGITAALASSIVVTVILALRSAIATNVAAVQDVGAAILAATLAISAGSLVAAPEARVATAFAIIAISSLVTAVVLFATGQFNAARIVRFFPLEVLAGFMAATGWFLLTGAVAVTTGAPPTLAAWLSLGDPQAAMLFLPALVLGFAIYVGQTRYPHPLTLIGLLFAATALFHAWRHLSGMSIDDAANAALLPTLGETAVLSLPFPAMLGDVHWATVFSSLPAIFIVAVLSLFGALMNVSALELSSGEDVDIGRELKLTGVANVFAGAAGGPPGYTDLAGSLLARNLGVRMRGAGLAMAAVEFAGLFWASTIIPYIPSFVAAGLITYYGIDLIREWLIGTREKFSLREWLVVVVIVAISSLYSFIVAILVGFFIATILFALSYAYTSIVRSETTLDRLPSTNDRPPQDTALLAMSGASVRILQLQGFLFFGTSEQVVVRVRNAAKDAQPCGLTRVILDFSKVTNMDSASANTFRRIENMADAQGFNVIYCGLNAPLLETMRRAGINFSTAGRLTICADLDRALERAEEDLLAERRENTGRKSPQQLLANHGLPEVLFEELLEHMSRVEYAPGEIIVRSGDDADMIYFIESGCAIVTRPMANGQSKRLRTMHPGSIVGEVAFSLGGTRTADVVAEQPTVAYRLSADQIAALGSSAPHLAIALHRLVSRSLAEKVVAANRMTEHSGQ
jgi:SulP family sulfate permease